MHIHPGIIAAAGSAGAITLVGTSPTNNTTPAFTIGFPENVAAGWVLVIDASTNDFASSTNYITHTLTAGNITDIQAQNPIALSGAASLSAGTWKFRGHLENGASIGANSADETIVIDTTAPANPTLSPTDNATGVATGASLTATFAEDIQFGATVSIIIKRTSDNVAVHTFTEANIGGAISIAGAVLTINPPSDLAVGTEYYVQIDATSIRDLAGNAFAGITTTTAWSFTTTSDVTAPSNPTLSPLDNATDVPIGANLTATFAENIQFGATVSITIKKTSDNSTIHSFTEANIGGAISIVGAVLTINPASDLANSTEYYVQVTSGSIEDLAGNAWAGISSTTGWSFTTAAFTFSPDNLFPATGGWWDVAASVADGSIYTDDGVTAATTDGQLIYRIDDRSGNGNHLTQATSGSRPILRNSGAEWWLEFDGTDDFIRRSFTLAQPFTRINALRQISWTSGDFVFSGTLNVCRLYQTGSSPNIGSRASSLVLTNTQATVGTNRVVTEVFNGASSSIAVDNNSAVTGTLDGDAAGGCTIGANANGSVAANIRWHGGIWIAGAMASGDRDSCQTYFGNLAGLSL